MAASLVIIRALPIVIAVLLVLEVSSHGYVESPRSRNFRAHEENKEYDQNGLNRKATDTNQYGSGLCGVSSGGHNYDKFLDEWKSEATYGEGDVIKITSRLTAYHGGHIEIGACADEEPTQKCFDRNKLRYRGGGHPRDEEYPERACEYMYGVYVVILSCREEYDSLIYLTLFIVSITFTV